MPDNPSTPIEAFGKKDIEKGLMRLAQKASNEGKIIDIAIYGGASMVLCYQARVSTRDVDAVIHNDIGFVRRACDEISDELNFVSNWLNDGVKGFVSDKDGDEGVMNFHKAYPDEKNPSIRIYTPSPEYLLAMKCIAMRIGNQSKDIDDIKYLMSHTGITKSHEVLDIVSEFYPMNRIEAKTQFGIIEICEKLESNKKKDQQNDVTP